MPQTDGPIVCPPAARTGRVALALAGLLLGGCLSHGAAGPANGAPLQLPAFKVTGEPLEDFGFRVSPDLDLRRSQPSRRVYTPVVDVVLPNTAASKAGVRPGDRVVTSDRMPTDSWSFNASKRHWLAIQERKWDEIKAGKSGVTWILEVETAGTGSIRHITLQLPTPAPHWGATAWQTPTDRQPVTVPEPGPLAERAGQVLNQGISTLLRGSYVRGFRLPTDAAQPHFLCYQWTLWDEAGGHRIYVSRQRGRTDIILEAIAAEGGGFFAGLMPARSPERNLASATTVFATKARVYLTAPDGRLAMAWNLPRLGNQEEIMPADAMTGFRAELDFWLNKVGPGSSLWPLEVIGAEGGQGTRARARPGGSGAAVE